MANIKYDTTNVLPLFTEFVSSLTSYSFDCVICLQNNLQQLKQLVGINDLTVARKSVNYFGV